MPRVKQTAYKFKNEEERMEHRRRVAEMLMPSANTSGPRTKQTVRRLRPEEDDHRSAQMLRIDFPAVVHKYGLYDEGTREPYYSLPEIAGFLPYSEAAPHAWHLQAWGQEASLIIACRLYERLQEYKASMLRVLEAERGDPHAVVGGIGLTIGQMQLMRYKELKPWLEPYTIAQLQEAAATATMVQAVNFAENESRGKICTPIRNYAHICLLDIENKLDRHPWATFLKWLLHDHLGYRIAWQMNEGQCFRTNLLEVTFVYEEVEPFVLITFLNREESTEEFLFFLYGSSLAEIDTVEELTNLIKFVKRTVKNDRSEHLQFGI